MADYPLHRTMMNSSTSIEFDSEPQLKRARLHFEVTETCTENNESIKTEKEKSNNSEVDLNGGDSGFQDFVSGESLSNSCPSFSNNAETPGISFFHSNESKSLPEVADFTDSLDDVLDECSKNLTDIAPCCSKNLPSNSNEEDNEEDDQLSVISDISCLSSLSDLEDAEKWQSNFGPLNWVQQQITSGTNPREIINEILPNNSISSQVGNLTLWKFIVNILSEPPKRTKLPNVNLLSDVVSLIERSKKILVLTGAGISVSSGIPDFRSRDGIYARLSVDFPDLPDPQAMFDINYFRKDQRPFFKFAKELYPGQFQPSICHRFIRQIERNGKLLRNYTQNIDTLEKSAGIERVITCHGSFATASCTNCKHRVDCLEIKEDIFAQRIPKCPKCVSLFDQQESNTFDLQENLANISDESITCDSQSQSQERKMCVMKPDIVFFGEGLPDEFHNSVSIDKSDCDLLIVIGSSLKVKPVALIPTSIPSEIPQILINREPLPHMTFDVELLGDCDVIVQELCNRLGDGWNNICVNEKLTETVEHSDFNDFVVNHEDLQDRYLFFPPNHYVFKGAELQGWKDSDSSDDEDI